MDHTDNVASSFWQCLVVPIRPRVAALLRDVIVKLVGRLAQRQITCVLLIFSSDFERRAGSYRPRSTFGTI